MSVNKARGTNWESAIVRHLIESGAVHAERRALAGALDKGDIAGIPGLVVEAKNHARIDLAGWLDEANTERDNAGAALGVVWAKRRGRASAGAGYVVMDGATFVQLLRDADYIPAQQTGAATA